MAIHFSGRKNLNKPHVFIPTGSNLLRLRFVEFHPSRNGVAEARFRARTA